MRGTVNINGKDVELVANAASPYLYRQIFQEDFLRKIQEKDPDTDLMQRMGFVMAAQAKMSTSEVLKLTQADFLEWLTDFDPLDILTATEEISDLYFRQAKGLSTPKKQGG